MKVEKVIIENFGPYYGRNEIDLSLSGNEGKNIVVVYGENGAGKTTFLTALIWCLYGNGMQYVDAGWDEYWKKIRTDELLNKEEKARPGAKKQSVEIVFSDVDAEGVPAKRISVRRERKTGDGAKDRISIFMNEQAVAGDDSADKKVKEQFVRENILPLEVAKFFLFDAQKIISFSDFTSNEQNEKLAQSFSQVLGILSRQELKDRLENIRIGYRAQRATPEQQAKFKELSVRVESLSEILIPEKEKEIEEKKSESDRVADELEKAVNELIETLGGATQEEVESLNREISDAEKDCERYGEGLKDAYSLVPFAIAGKLCSETKEQLSNEEISQAKTETEAEFSEKIENVLHDLEQCAYDEHVVPNKDAHRLKDFFLQELPGILRKHFGNDDATGSPFPSDFSVFLNGGAGAAARFSELLSKVAASGAKFDEFKERYRNAGRIRDEKKRKLEKLKSCLDDGNAVAMQERVNDLRVKLGKAEGGLQVANSEKERLAGELTDKKKQLSVLDKELRIAQGFNKKSELMDVLVADLEKFIRALQEKKTGALRERILRGVQQLMHKKNRVADVSVEFASREGLRVKFLGADKEELPSMSEGERQLCASALLQALSDESGFEFPVFIDSPLQKFDREHAENMVRMFYPNVSAQVVFFPLLGKELTRDEYEILLPHVDKIYRIANKNNRSRFECVTGTATDVLFPPSDEEEKI